MPPGVGSQTHHDIWQAIFSYDRYQRGAASKALTPGLPIVCRRTKCLDRFRESPTWNSPTEHGIQKAGKDRYKAVHLSQSPELTHQNSSHAKQYGQHTDGSASVNFDELTSICSHAVIQSAGSEDCKRRKKTLHIPSHQPFLHTLQIVTLAYHSWRQGLRLPRCPTLPHTSVTLG